MKKYTFTFGFEHKLTGKCQPVIASSSEEARNKMVELYGYEWCLQYDEEKWAKICNNEKRTWVLPEELETITCEQLKLEV